MGYSLALKHFYSRAFCLSLLVCLAGCWGSGSGDVGKPCESVAVLYPEDSYLSQVAKECSSGLCLKPIDQTLERRVDTQPLCTTSCGDDGDCEGQVRDRNNPADYRCILGFACLMPFDSGDKACQKMCVCRDFLTAGPVSVPPNCR